MSSFATFIKPQQHSQVVSDHFWRNVAIPGIIMGLANPGFREETVNMLAQPLSLDRTQSAIMNPRAPVPCDHGWLFTWLYPSFPNGVST